jgi:small subunit ribosomal protein S3Ae
MFLGNGVFGKTLVKKTTNSQNLSEILSNRIYNVSLADIYKKENFSYRKIKLKGIETKDGTCSTNFFGMDITRDKYNSLIRKWQSTIEVNLDLKTEDGFFLRIFCVAFSKKRKKQSKKTSYLNSSEIRAIRRKIIEVILKITANQNLKLMTLKFLSERLNREIEKACKIISPIYNFFIRKIKLLKEKK